MKPIFCIITFLAVITWHLGAEESTRSDAEWSRWRGPNRDGVSHETGLLKSWPESGPNVLWRTPAKDGYSSIAISQGRLYTMETEWESELATCRLVSSGEKVWTFRTDAKFHNGTGDGPRSTPIVDGDRVFVLGASGKLYALDAKTGAELWKRDFMEEFGSNRPGWGFSASPIVEGDLLIVEVGGKDSSIIAFDKHNGNVVWETHKGGAGYSSPIAITFNEQRQLLFLTEGSLVSVSPTDGEIYWEYPWPGGINIATPIFIPPDKIFLSCSYDKGSVLLQMATVDGVPVAEMVWENKVMKNHFNSSVLLGDYLYGFDNGILKCITADTSVEQWKTRGFGKGALILADGHLIILGENGKLALAEATPEAYKEKGQIQILEGKCWTVPTLADGRLYVRNQKEIVCVELKRYTPPPHVVGDWVGTWGVSGAPNAQQQLDCRVVASNSGQWQATFEGECGRPYKYTIEMLGRQAGNVVLFKGSADLGEADGGVYDWIGQASADKFVGFYTSRKYTGTFEMTRTSATEEQP